MTNKNLIHLAVVSIINLIVISLMIHTAWKGNDKAILVIILLYPILTTLNAFIWFILFCYKLHQAKIYKYTTIGLIAMFIPALMIAGSH